MEFGPLPRIQVGTHVLVEMALVIGCVVALATGVGFGPLPRVQVDAHVQLEI